MGCDALSSNSRTSQSHRTSNKHSIICLLHYHHHHSHSVTTNRSNLHISTSTMSAPISFSSTRGSCILKAITSPGKFVERLERRTPSSTFYKRRSNTQIHSGSSSSSHPRILSLDIHRDGIGMALVSPPCSSSANRFCKNSSQRIRDVRGFNSNSNMPMELPWIPTAERRINPEASCNDDLLSIHDIVTQHNVCGFVVSWPLEPDTGKMGATCGRVWYTLEALQAMNLSSSSSSQHSSLFSCSRPICLWDPHRTVEEAKRLDDWGRSWEFTRTSTAREYHASTERYYKKQDEGDETRATMAPIQLWMDFCHAHWPEATADQEWQELLNGQAASSSAAAEDETPAVVAPPPRSKHLFVDRQLRLAVAAAA